MPWVDILDLPKKGVYTAAADTAIRALCDPLTAPLFRSLPDAPPIPLCTECEKPVLKEDFGSLKGSHNAWILDCGHFLDGDCAHWHMSSAVYFEKEMMEESDGSLSFKWECPNSACKDNHLIFQESNGSWTLGSTIRAWVP